MSSSIPDVEQLERVQRKAARRELDWTKNWKAYKRQQPLRMKSMIESSFLFFMAWVKKYQFFSIELCIPLPDSPSLNSCTRGNLGSWEAFNSLIGPKSCQVRFRKSLHEQGRVYTNSRETTVEVWSPQIIEQPMVQVLAILSLEANKKYTQPVLEVLLLGISPRLAGSFVRLPNGFLPSIFCDSSPPANMVESPLNADISLKGGN